MKIVALFCLAEHQWLMGLDVTERVGQERSREGERSQRKDRENKQEREIAH